MMGNFKMFACAVLAAGALAAPAAATTGPGCLRVVNVASWDVLNMRARPSASSRVVAAIDPDGFGVLALRGTCVPRSVAWGSRWCPVAYSDDRGTRKGWVKARFVRDAECP